jgi:AcrR family transcriptional regulator
MTDAVAPAPRVPLSRDRVLVAAVELADREGIEALSMRRLAQQLGVEAMTLYYHVANKEQLVAGMVALAMAEIELPPADGDWRPALRRTAVSAHGVLIRHGWAGARMMTGGLTPERLNYMESILGCLRAGGFSPYQTHLAYHALESHIVGFALWLEGMNLPDDVAALAADVLAEVPADAFPAFVEHIHVHLREPRDTDVGAFEFGLDLLLDGFERMRNEGSGADEGVSRETGPRKNR